MLIMSAITMLAQNMLQVSETDMSGVVFREAGDNETVVEVKSNVKLEFESTMDRTVNVYKTYQESGFFFYELLFSTDKKYSGRKLKIKSYGFDTHTQALDLKAKMPVGLLVINPDSEVGVGCYYEHLNKGNKFFENTQYADAKTEYYIALECSDVPEDNDLSKKIEDAGTCLDAKRDADNYYNMEKLDEALKEYEKIYAINPKDTYTKTRVNLCIDKIANQPRVIKGKATNTQGAVMSDVKIEAEFYKDKNGKPKTEWRSVGKTDWQGRYAVTVLRETTKMRFSKDERSLADLSKGTNNYYNRSTADKIIGGVSEYYKKTKYKAEVQITSDEIDVVLKEVVL